MRAFVFTDKALERQAGRFVWLSVNTEKRENAAVLAKFPVQAWPSFYVIDSATETAVLRYVGGATVSQLQQILDDGARAAGAPGRPNEALARADRLFGEGKNAEAAGAYREALKQIPAGASSYARSLESLLFALQASRQMEACAATARDAFPKLLATPSAANVAGTGLDCALSIAETVSGKAQLVAILARDARDVLASKRSDLSADDVSSLYETLAQERHAAKDDAGAKMTLDNWAAYLEEEAAKTKTADARSVFDSHRLSAYLSLGEPERAVPMLQASERDLPDDYNPPARLAVALRALKRYDEALAASDRALAKAYGPRKLGILQTRADLFAKKGEEAAARKTLEEALAFAESLPIEQRSERTIAALKKQLEAPR